MHRHPARSLATSATLLTLASCGAGGLESSNSLTDTIAPQAGQVFDGSDADLTSQASSTELSANWVGFVDDSGLIASYEWAIGTSPGGTQVQTWASVGGNTSAANSTLVLEPGQTYFCAVRAYDAAGNVSVAASSNGVLIEPPSTGGNSGGGGSTGGSSGGGSSGGGSGGTSGSGGSAGGGTSGGGSGGSGEPQQTLASSISNFGITWQFGEAMPVGQFANGDWWVVGPVDIISISPPSQEVSGRIINGSMLNPGQAQIENGEHGYDSTLFGPYAGNRYQPALNVAWGVSQNSPLQLAGGNSLISTISWTDPNPPSNGSFSQLKTAAVLTILSEAAPEGAFRPPYSGTDKSIRHNEAELDYTALAQLETANAQPDYTTIADNFDRVWLDHCSSWTSRYLHPVENMPDYGRDFTSLFGTGALLLQLNRSNAEKRDMLVRMTQIGIDFFGNVQNGGVWSGVGGQCSGRKFPILLAGRVLNDAAMLNLGVSHPSGYFGPNHPNNSEHFGEDCQTFYVEQTSPGTYNWGYGNYNASHNELAEWGNSHTQFPQNDNSDWMGDAYRRCCTGNAWVGQTLAARVMNLRTAWNHPAYFDYMDIFMVTEGQGEWTRSWEPWQGNMWDLHRSNF